MNDNESVKLVPNAFVKDILQKAKEAKHNIEVDEESFMVRDNKTNYVVFRGIRIRNNCWGLTFAKDLS